jgi:hypothetical protein
MEFRFKISLKNNQQLVGADSRAMELTTKELE